MDGEDQDDTKERHQEPAAYKIRQRNHDDAADQGHHRALFLAVDEIAQANRAPEQRGEQETGVKKIIQSVG